MIKTTCFLSNIVPAKDYFKEIGDKYMKAMKELDEINKLIAKAESEQDSIEKTMERLRQLPEDKSGKLEDLAARHRDLQKDIRDYKRNLFKPKKRIQNC